MYLDSRGQPLSDPATLGVLPSVAPTTIFGTVAHQLPRLTAQGYSAEVLSQLSHSRVSSSNQTYESKWKLFASYCSRHSLDPFTATLPVVADFMLWLANSRHASVSTLAGYRAALGQVLRLTTGFDPGSCPILAQLMKSFKRTQPVPAKRIPTWDISLVLSVLCDQDLSNESLSLHLLTAKTIFLLALASGERRHAIAAFQNNPTFDAEGMVIHFAREYVPKSYYVRKNTTTIKPLHIPYVSDDSYVQVCPCRTTQFYLHAVADVRRSVQTTLFVSHNLSKHGNITPQGISRYIIKLIHFCYEKAGAQMPDCRAHDVRKIAASLRALTGESLSDVLEAGHWSSPYTFLKHYFVSVGRHETNSVTRPIQIVAAKQNISLSFQAQQ